MNATNTAPATTRRVLNQKETFQLLTWYKENQERLLHITDEGIIAEVSQVLKIEGLNLAHLTTARKTLGIQKRESRKPAPPSADLEAMQCLINEQADKLMARSVTLQNLLDRVRRLETTR